MHCFVDFAPSHRGMASLRQPPAVAVRPTITLVSLLCLCAVFAAGASRAAEAPDRPVAYLEDLDADPALTRTGPPVQERVREFLMPLGAIQKVRGVWSPDDSERITGERLAYTWRVQEGFRAADFVAALDARLEEDSGASVLFACEARACGSSVQWANQIFEERVLYGRVETQRYRAWRIERGGLEFRLLVYGAARTTDRQYLRVELITLARPDQ